MACWLKQSTAVDVKVGPFVDETDGKTAETALTITQPDILLGKNGGAFAQKNAAQTLTHESIGWYEVSLDTTDTNTLGILILAIHESGALPVWREFMVVPAEVYDAVVSGSGNGLRADVRAWAGTVAATPTVAGIPEVDVTHFNGVAGTFASGRPEVNTTHAAGTAWGSGAITAASIAGDAITAAKIADGAIDAATFAASAINAAAIAADAITAAKIADGAIDANTFAAGAITATAIAADALTAAKFAADVTTELQSGLATAANLATLQTSVNTLDDFVDTEVAAIKTVTDKLDTAVELDGAVYRFTTNALEQAPTGGGAADGSGFTAIPWNAAWDAEVQSEVADALTVYDPPTRAEATSDADSIKALLPAALVGGRIDANVGAISADSVAADNAESFFDGTGYAGTGNTIPTVTTLTGHTPQTGDAFARLGAPAGASVSADVAAVKVQTGAIETDTQDIQARIPAALVAGRIDASVGAMANGTITAAAHAAGAIDAAALASDAGNEIADALLARNIAGGSSVGRTVKQALAALRNKWVIAAGTLTVYDTDDTTILFTATITTAAGNPISGSDPA